MNQVLKLRDRGLEWVDAGSEIIALDADRDMYMAGNETTRTLWPLLVQGATREALVDELVSTYEVDAAVASDDVETFIQKLDAKGLLSGS